MRRARGRRRQERKDRKRGEKKGETRVTDENIRGDLIPDKSNFTHVGDFDTSGKAEPDEGANDIIRKTFN